MAIAYENVALPKLTNCKLPADGGIVDGNWLTLGNIHFSLYQLDLSMLKLIYSGYTYLCVNNAQCENNAIYNKFETLYKQVC